MGHRITAVILAGYGNRLYPLVDDSSSGIPKALLPIANKPMIWYTLQWLESNSIHDILVVVSHKSSARISHFLHKIYQRIFDSTKIELVTTEDYPGTIHALQAVRDKIPRCNDVLVTGCDLIANFSLDAFFDCHKLRNAALSTIFYLPYCSTGKPQEAVTSAGKSTNLHKSTHSSSEFISKNAHCTSALSSDASRYGDVIGTDAAGSKLLYYASNADVDENISISMPIMHDYGMLRLHSECIDAHAYLIKKCIFDQIWESPDNAKNAVKFFSLREDFIPHLVNFRCIGECYVTVVNDLNSCARVNSIPSYVDVNRIHAKSISDTERISSSANVHSKAQIGAACLVGDNSIIEEKCSIKKSVIGANVRVGSGCKITDCILMDHVVIEPGCRLDGVVVGYRGTLGEKCSLKDCDVGCSVSVERETVAKGDCFTDGMGTFSN